MSLKDFSDASSIGKIIFLGLVIATIVTAVMSLFGTISFNIPTFLFFIIVAIIIIFFLIKALIFLFEWVRD